MVPTKIEDHVFSTYITLRYGMAFLAIGFPLLIYLIGKEHGLNLQNSLSAYYWASLEHSPRVRDWFVGMLFAFAAFLYLYKGFTDSENWALNFAALFALGVAIIPMQWPENPNDHSFSAHGVCAVMLFVALGYVVIFRSKDTLKYLPEEASACGFGRESLIRIYKFIYAVLGIALLVSPITAVVLSRISQTEPAKVFFEEASGVVVFGWYWLVKSHELRRSRVTRRALKGEFK
jgi:hypothetical protein